MQVWLDKLSFSPDSYRDKARHWLRLDKQCSTLVLTSSKYFQSIVARADGILFPNLHKALFVVGYAMTYFKLITNFFFCTVLFVGCRSTKDGEQLIPSTAIINWKRIDTTKHFSTTTKILKSNKIPDSVFKMTQLEYLTISGMDCDYGDNTNCWMLNEIPGSIKNLQELKSLSLTLNAIKSIPIELTDLKKLKAIDLTDNAGLSAIEPLTKIQGLEYLWLYGCGLTKLPDDIDNLKNLKQLGLIGNNLDKQEQTRIKKALPNCIINF